MLFHLIWQKTISKKAINKNNTNFDNDQILEIIYEGFGPGGAAIIIESMTDNKNKEETLPK